MFSTSIFYKRTYCTEKVRVSLCLSEKRFVLCDGVLVQHLLCVCFVGQLKSHID